MTLERHARRQQFDGYAALLVAHPNDAIVVDELDESAQTFSRAVRAAAKRAGLQATVRTLRGQAEVRFWLTGEPPLRPAPAISLAALQTIGDQVIAAGSYWFNGGAKRIDTLVTEHGYTRRSRIAWQRNRGDAGSVAMTLADADAGDQLVSVAVIGTAFFRELFGDPLRGVREEGTAR